MVRLGMLYPVTEMRAVASDSKSDQPLTRHVCYHKEIDAKLKTVK